MPSHHCITAETVVTNPLPLFGHNKNYHLPQQLLSIYPYLSIFVAFTISIILRSFLIDRICLRIFQSPYETDSSYFATLNDFHNTEAFIYV